MCEIFIISNARHFEEAMQILKDLKFLSRAMSFLFDFTVSFG